MGPVTITGLIKTSSSLLPFSFLCFQSNHSNISKIGSSHVAFTVDDLDKTYEKFIVAGIKFNAPPQNSPDGYAKVTFCHDPDDTLIELVQVLDPTILEKTKN